MQFTPDVTLAVYFGMSKFDKVIKKDSEGNPEMKDGKYRPRFDNIEQAKKDCDDLR